MTAIEQLRKTALQSILAPELAEFERHGGHPLLPIILEAMEAHRKAGLKEVLTEFLERREMTPYSLGEFLALTDEDEIDNFLANRI